MFSFHLILVVQEAILYGLLAYVALAAARAERHTGNDHSCSHLRRAGILYAMLGVSQLVQF